ncbi:MAG: hypothetical protein M1823_005493 [Watsoniomyces obsoletus]|nr:MAG: hypothetical protein M1823_005493 [Watsoniomyces obsoletus]
MPRPPVPIRMMKHHAAYDVVNALRHTEVTGLKWGQLLDMAPKATLEIGRSLVRERKKKIVEDTGISAQTEESLGDVIMEEAPQALAAIDDTYDRGSNYYTQVMVRSPNGRKFRVSEVLIDSGATVNCISDAAANKLSLPRLTGRSTTIKNADGRTTYLHHHVELPFTIAGVKSRAIALIVEGKPPFSLLLGRPWMNQVDIRGRYGSDSYMIKNAEGIWVELGNTNRETEDVVPGHITRPNREQHRNEVHREIRSRHIGEDEAEDNVLAEYADRELRDWLGEERDSDHSDDDEDEIVGAWSGRETMRKGVKGKHS